MIDRTHPKKVSKNENELFYPWIVWGVWQVMGIGWEDNKKVDFAKIAPPQIRTLKRAERTERAVVSDATVSLLNLLDI